MKRAQSAAWWLAPPALCLALQWLSFTAWFRADDFAWLSLGGTVHNPHDLLLALFAPQAQGTIRPLSERAFFMAGYALFGLNVLPYRIVIFATQFANLALVAWIGVRLSGLRAAGFWAAVFWAVNSTLTQPLGWACVYNEVLCAFFLLLAFFFLLRYLDTGLVRYEILQWTIFLLGFGALETNLVYPALAAGYTLLSARRRFLRTLPMFAVSAAYAAVHLTLAPAPGSGAYTLHFGATSMLGVLKTYWIWSVGPIYSMTPLALPHWMLPAGVTLISLGLAAFLAWELRARNLVVLFFPLWYLATIGPLLPLRDHIIEYYPFIPLIGACWLGGWAVVRAWRSSSAARVAAVALAALYGVTVIPQTVVGAEWNHTMTKRTSNLMEGLVGAQQKHPRQQVMLVGVDRDLFENAISDKGFRLAGIHAVYLAPDTARASDSPQYRDDLARFVLPGALVARALDRNQVVVYDVRGPLLRNVTSSFRGAFKDRSLPLRIDVGSRFMADFLGPEWYPLETDHRWMPRRATLRIGGAARLGQRLYLFASCPTERLQAGPLLVTVTVDGASLAPVTIPTGSASFEISFLLPDSAVGKAELQLTVEVNRATHAPNDPRELGLSFGVVEIR